MKHPVLFTLGFAVALVAVFIFIPSWTHRDPEPTVTETVYESEPEVETIPESEPVPDPGALEDGFVVLIRETYPTEYEYESDGDIIELGYAVCAALDSGVSFVEIVNLADGTGIPGYAAAFTAGAAIGMFCPEHSDKITE